MTRGRPARQIEARERGRRDVDLAGEMRHRVRRQLRQAPWESSAPEQELQQRREPEPGGAGLVAQQLKLIADQREVVDDLIETDLRRQPNRSIQASISLGSTVLTMTD